MPPNGPAYDTDWVISTNGYFNASIANNRGWFTDYHDFPTWYTTRLPDGRIGYSAAMGVGSIKLHLRKNAEKQGNDEHTIRDVLYVPGAICNTLSVTDLRDVTVTTRGESHGGGAIRDKKTGQVLAVLDQGVLPKLWLRGQQQGKSTLPRGLSQTSLSSIYGAWLQPEIDKWCVYYAAVSNEDEGQPREAAKRVVRASYKPPHKDNKRASDGSFISLAGPPHSKSTLEDPPYTTKEKQWLRKNYHSETHFLMLYKLKVYDDLDRQEGRLIARTLMKDPDAGLAEAARHLDLQEEKLAAEAEADPLSHQADRFFNEEELAWIAKHYKHSGSFLELKGFEADNDVDCKQGVALVRELMKAERSRGY